MTIKQYFNRIGLYLLFFSKPFYDKVRDTKLVHWLEKRYIYRRDMKNLDKWRTQIHKYAQARLMGPEVYYNTYYEIFELSHQLRKTGKTRDILRYKLKYFESKIAATHYEIINPFSYTRMNGRSTRRFEKKLKKLKSIRNDISLKYDLIINQSNKISDKINDLKK